MKLHEILHYRLIPDLKKGKQFMKLQEILRCQLTLIYETPRNFTLPVDSRSQDPQKKRPFMKLHGILHYRLIPDLKKGKQFMKLQEILRSQLTLIYETPRKITLPVDSRSQESPKEVNIYETP